MQSQANEVFSRYLNWYNLGNVLNIPKSSTMVKCVEDNMYTFAHIKNNSENMVAK